MASVTHSYMGLLEELKRRIQAAQSRAALAVNAELVRLYWEIGRSILERQATEGWGARVVDRLANDLKAAFPTMKGFSSRNLKYMRTFAERCPEGQIGQQPAAQLPWFHPVTLLTQVEGDAERAWLASQTLQQGWSRAILQSHIKNRLFERQGQAITNFEARLPANQAGLAQESLKDPYLFDFLGLGDEALERDIESALVRRITRFLLELGAGFAFVGRQFRLEVGDEEFFADLLFYRAMGYRVDDVVGPISSGPLGQMALFPQH